MKKVEKNKLVRVKWVGKNPVGGGKKNQKSNQDCVPLCIEMDIKCFLL